MFKQKSIMRRKAHKGQAPERWDTVKGYLTVSEAAARKGITPAAIYLAVQQERLPSTKILGRIAIKEKDIDAYEPLPNDQRKGVKLGKRTPRKSAQEAAG
jgi:hypothetical protein